MRKLARMAEHEPGYGGSPARKGFTALLFLHNLNRILVAHNDLGSVAVKLHLALELNHFALEALCRVFDLGVLELGEGFLVDEDREILGVLKVLLGVQEADALAQRR
jgi:hypothetical protein